jgi:transcription-repair coupling factor (superfamily II helicase)
MASALLAWLGRSDALSNPDIDLVEVASPLLPFALASRASENFITVVTHSTRMQNDLTTALRHLLGDEAVAEFPAWETLPHERLSPQSDTVARRIETRYRLTQLEKSGRSDLKVVVTQVRALLQPLIQMGEEVSLELEVGNEKPLDEIISLLVLMAYRRVDLVERRGDFAVRGGIIDLFPATFDHPIRIDLFGDEIESITPFSLSDQRSLQQTLSRVRLLPCKELLITAKVRERAEELSIQYPELAEIASRIAIGSYPDGMESIASLLADEMIPFHSLLPTGSELIVVESARVRTRSIELNKTDEEFLSAAWSSAAHGGQTPLDSRRDHQRDLRERLQSGSFLAFDDVIDEMKKSLTVRSFDSYLSHGVGVESDERDNRFKAWPSSPHSPYRGDTELLLRDLRRWITDGYRVVVTAPGSGLVKRYDEFISSELPTRIVHRFDQLDAGQDQGFVYLAKSPLPHGFVSDQLKVAYLTDRDIQGGRGGRGDGDSAGTRLPSKRRKQIDPLSLSHGDLVVHEHHGIGKFIELTKRTIAGGEREYLVIEYAPAKRGHPGDRIYLPTDSLELITKYIGGEKPALNRIGGSEWIKSKARAKKAIKEIAAELIKLYAARMSLPGYAYSPDTAWQRELEDAFPFVETPDQLVTIEDVKRDMESPRPMDRLVCGDVGYGKTEIAIRAAFKAVQDGKQVAILVPTTLLVQQHFATFSNRFAGFPVRLAALSRFNTASESKSVIRSLSEGSIDVVIGTHRLLSSDVTFKDLGLVIIDEEQRFGVEHKESLKKLRASIDVLAMSATPIPRTLEMAITGIREMSTITTPPEERHPILTYVGVMDPKQIQAAIHRELLRDGQVFYLHNRVESIDQAAIRLRNLVPEARIAIAHGQMSENMLEEVILAFWNRDFDVLVATTIIENGIDVANANTLIVERADTFGLSQLHQLRGRVGRGRERGYAYFLYDGDKPLSEVAHDRLTTIATNTDLGAGMQVALKDLEIRGAGNLLGGEQSGHIADVGFDLYMRMVSETVAEMKASMASQGFAAGLAESGQDSEDERRECKVEIPVTAHLPYEYIESDRLRLDLYRRLAESHQESELEEIVAELTDRFGALPVEARLLVEVARIRNSARALGITDLIWQGRQLKVAPITLPESKELRIKRLYPGSIYKRSASLLLLAHPMSGLSMVPGGGADANGENEESTLAWVRSVLDALA